MFSPHGRRGKFRCTDQKISFNANCSCRAEPESPMGDRVAVIWPKLFPAAVLTMRLGCAKFGWLKILKVSARNCALRRSVMRVSLYKATSRFSNPGPTRRFRPMLPKPAGTWKRQPGVAAAPHVKAGKYCGLPFAADPIPTGTGPRIFGRIVFETPLKVEPV